MVDGPASPRCSVVHGLGTVAVGIEQEGPVVVVAVLGPRARPSVVGIAGIDARLPELVDLLARGRDEPDVEPRGTGVRVIGAGQLEVLPLRERARPVGPVYAQRRQDRVVEALG